MADTVLWRTDDELSQTNLGEAAGQSNRTDYVEHGISLTVDYTDDTVDITTGKAYLLHQNQGYALLPDARTGLALADGTTLNYIYLTFDTGQQNAISYEIATAKGDVSQPKLLVGTADGSSSTTVERNRDPYVTTRGLEVEALTRGTLTHTGGSATSATFADVTDDPRVDTAQTQLLEVLVAPASDPSWSADYAFNYDWSRQWDDSDGEVDVEVAVNWDTDPGSGNDLDLDVIIIPWE